MTTENISLGAVEDSDEQLNKFGTRISIKMGEFFKTEMKDYPNNGDYLFIAPTLIGKITRRDVLLSKEGKVSSEIVFGTGMIVFDNDLLTYTTNPEIADNIHKMLHQVLNHASKKFVGNDVDIERNLISQVAKEQHLRLKATEKLIERTKIYEDNIVSYRVKENELLKKIRDLEEELNKNIKEVEKFQELYRRARSDKVR